jgi:hypothetical protein
MRKSLGALLVLAAAVALVLPALGIGGSDGRKVLDARVLAPVSEPYTGAANPIRGVPGGGLPWEIDSAKVDLRADGRLQIEVEGLVLARRAPVPHERQGTNPLPQFKAIVSCQTTSGGAATVENVSTEAFAASPHGDAEIETSIHLPAPCYGPIVFLTTTGGAWLAVTGR